MKSISSAFSAHLDKEVTTLATCWKIVRRDGTTFRFTDHDVDVVLPDGLYFADSTYDRTAVASNSDFSVDNLDVAGMIDSAQLSEEELRNGLFNKAEIEIFMINWADTTQGILKVRRGWFGEVQVRSDGTFEVEIRGLAQALGHNVLEVYSPECRADFCDARCKLKIEDFTYVATVTDSGNNRDKFTASDAPAVPTVGTSVGAHRSWSILPTNFALGTAFAIAEIRFWDQEDKLIEGGVADASGWESKYTNPSKARDKRMGSMWRVKDTEDEDGNAIPAMGQRWMITFPQPVDVKSVEIVSTNLLNETPTAYRLEYSDDPGPYHEAIDWSLAMPFDHTFTVGGQSAVWTIPQAEPLNIATTPVDVPPPYKGISTYVGGTITWTTGRNRGRVVEITDHDPDTNEFEMFEPMSYPVREGDKFELAQGCNKTLENCKKYGNVINRRAEDFVPGNDELMNYPNAQA